MPHPLRTRLTIAQLSRLLGCEKSTVWRRWQAGDYGPQARPSHTIKINLGAIEEKHGAFTRDEIERACLVDRY